MERVKSFIQRGVMCVGVLATSHLTTQNAFADRWYQEFNPVMIDQDRSYPVESVPEVISRVAVEEGLNPEQLLRISWCESKWDPNAKNISGASGLWQFMPSTKIWAESLLGRSFSDIDIEASTRAAALVMKEPRQGGFKHWSCK